MAYAPGILITHCSKKYLGNVTCDCCLRARMVALISNVFAYRSSCLRLCHLLDVSIVRRGFRQHRLPSRLNNSLSTFSFLHLSCTFQSLPFTIDTTPPLTRSILTARATYSNGISTTILITPPTTTIFGTPIKRHDSIASSITYRRRQAGETKAVQRGL
jgi:hypothetical protein